MNIKKVSTNSFLTSVRIIDIRKKADLFQIRIFNYIWTLCIKTCLVLKELYYEIDEKYIIKFIIIKAKIIFKLLKNHQDCLERLCLELHIVVNLNISGKILMLNLCSVNARA